MKAKLYINRKNLIDNINDIKEKIGDKEIIAMVKANAYGIGDREVVSILQSIGIKNFGVANIDEALRVRKIAKDEMIIITSVTMGGEIKEAIENNITMSVSDIQNIEEINNVAKELGINAKVHIKIDTGMTRLGFSPKDIIERKEELKNYSFVTFEGIYTHLSCADVDDEYTKSQIDEFKRVLDALSDMNFKYIHFLNSDGVFKYSNYLKDYTHVRVGIAMYGYAYNLKPILRLTAPIIHINNVENYKRISYGGTALAKPNEKVAVVKIGYADGLSRKLSNNLVVTVNGKKCRQVGNICMDMMMVDVTNTSAQVSDEVEIFSTDDNLQEIAKNSSKIVYEVISSLGTRIERIIE